MTLPQILQAHDDTITAAVAAFQTELEAIVSAAKAKLQARLHEALVLDAAGNIKRTRANSKILAKLDDWFVQEMAASGFVHLSREFVNQFPGQLPFFDQVVEWLAAQAKTAIPKIDWTASDKRMFSDYASNARLSLEAVVANVASTAKNQVLFTFGGLKYKDLLATLAQKLDVTVERVVTLADTSMATFYRTAATAGFQKLEFYFRGIRYIAAGPLDKLCRPFCRNLMEQSRGGKSWTREEIDGMDNGQIPNVMLSFGGWNCRHSFVIQIQSAQASA